MGTRYLFVVLLLLGAAGVHAETWQESCPNVWGNNPYNWGRIQKNFQYYSNVDGWQSAPSANQERIPLPQGSRAP